MDNYNWSVGETVSLPRKISHVKRSLTSYEHLIASRYICIREANDSQRGILVKVLGKVPREHIIMAGGEPFCKDDKEEGFTGDIYYGYRFPSVEELKEVLDIFWQNQSLIGKFDKASMHVNPSSTFWVRDTVRKMLLMKKPQYYNARSGELLISSGDNDVHYRLTIAYFSKSQLSW